VVNGNLVHFLQEHPQGLERQVVLVTLHERPHLGKEILYGVLRQRLLTSSVPTYRTEARLA
jgi:hypothetical protein